MRSTGHFAGGACAAIIALSACANSGSQTAMPTDAPHAMLVHPDKKSDCPRSKYSLGCVTITPSGSGETITFSCSGGSGCPVHKWTMYNEFYTLKGEPANRDLVGKWSPNPYYSGPSTYTINLIAERHALKPSSGVKYIEDLLACPAQSSCTGLGTVGIIPRF